MKLVSSRMLGRHEVRKGGILGRGCFSGDLWGIKELEEISLEDFDGRKKWFLLVVRLKLELS